MMDKKIAVLGAGESGVGAAILGKKKGYEVFLSEKENINKKLICFCVGHATEKKARSFGFQNVVTAEGNVENLKELILRNFDKKNKKLIYVSGEMISINLDQQLSEEGYDIQRIINYNINLLQYAI